MRAGQRGEVERLSVNSDMVTVDIGSLGEGGEDEEEERGGVGT